MSELTLADFRQYPVWEYAEDEEDVVGQDETTVRPVKGRECVDPFEATSIVASTFVLADGSEFAGTMYTPGRTEFHVGNLQPVLITETGKHILFWWGIRGPSREDMDAAYESIGKSAEEIFPIEASYLPGTVIRQIRCVVPGFMKLREFLGHDFDVIT